MSRLLFEKYYSMLAGVRGKCEIRVGNLLIMTLDPRKRDESEIGWTFLFGGGEGGGGGLSHLHPPSELLPRAGKATFLAPEE